MNRLVFSLFTFYMLFVLHPVVFSQHNRITKSIITQNTETVAVLQSARSQIHLLIDNIPVENLKDYGFKSKSEFAQIIFDNPVKVYTIKDSKIVVTSSYRVPIVIDNECRGLLTIIKQGDEYNAVDIGAKVLANEINTKKTSQTIGMLRVYEIKSDFLIQEFEKDQYKFIPIQGSKDKFYELSDILKMMKGIKL